MEVVLLLALVAVLTLSLHAILERRSLRKLAESLTHSGATGEDVARLLTRWVHESVPKLEDDPPFVSVSWLSWLGASPMQVVRDGGCCSGRARILVCLLQARGIKAAQLTVVHRSGEARHALVEACLDGRWRALEPHYGFVYHDGAGGPVGMLDMRAGVHPAFESPGGDPHDGYQSHPYYDFDYKMSTTANWTCSWVRRAVFWVLDGLTAGRIRIARQPHWAEWPQLHLIAGVLVATGFCTALLQLV